MRNMPRCQLCSWEHESATHDGTIPIAIAEIRRLRLCETHVRLLLEIAAAAGINANEAMGYEVLPEHRKAS